VRLFGVTVIINRLLLLALFLVLQESILAQHHLTSVYPTAGIQGATLTLSFEGNSFILGETNIEVLGGGLTITGITVTSPSSAHALAVLHGNPGLRSLRIWTPDGPSTPLDFLIEPHPFTVNSERDVSLLAGGPGGPGYLNGVGVEARFDSPTGVWGSGTSLFIGDSGTRNIRRLDLNTRAVATIGSLHNLECTARSVRNFSRNLSVVVDSSFVYVADSCLHVVYKLDRDGGEPQVLAGALQLIGSADGPAEIAQFNHPTFLWDNASHLYLRDDTGIRRVDKGSGETATVFTDITNIVAGDGTTVYRVEFGLTTHTLQAVDVSTHATTFLADLPQDHRLNLMSLRRIGNALFAVNFDNKIEKIDIATGSLTTFAGGVGTICCSLGDWKDGAGAVAAFSGPLAIWSDNDYLYVTEAQNNTVRRVSISTGEVTTLAGLPALFGDTDGVGATARFRNPGFAWGDGNYLYVTDSSSHVIRRVSLGNGQVSTFAGSPDPLSSVGISVDGVGAAARFNTPWGIWGDGIYLYVGDRVASIIRRITIATAEVTTVSGVPGDNRVVDGTADVARIRFPGGLWGDGTYLYFTDDMSVRRLDIATGAITTIAGTPGQYGGTDGVGAAARFGNPFALWGDGENLYVADFGIGTIRKIALVTNQVTTIAGAFSRLTGVWGDGTYLYVTDDLAETVRRVHIGTGETTTIAGLAEHRGSDNARGMAARFNGLRGIWGDGTDVYVTDRTNSAVRRLSIPKTGYEPVIGFVSSKQLTINTFEIKVNGQNFAAGEASLILGGAGLRVTEVNVESATSLSAQIVQTTERVSELVTLRIKVANLISNAASLNLRPVPDFTFVDYSLLPRSVVSRTTSLLLGAATAGYARIEPSAGALTPAGLQILAQKSGETLVSEVTIPASGLMRSGRIYLKATADVNTGIVIANPADRWVRISFHYTTLLGATFRQASLDIPPKTQVARFLNQTPFYGGGPNIEATFTFTASSPVSVIAIRGLVNERSEYLMSGSPVIDLDANVDSPLLFPVIAQGDGWSTELVLINPSDVSIDGRLQFVRQDGQQIDESSYSIQAKSALTLPGPRVIGGVFVGWVRVIPSNSTKSPVGSAIVRFSQAGVTVTETAALSANAAANHLLYVENSGNFHTAEPGSLRTGLALTNPGTVAADVVFELSSNASVVATHTMRILPGRQLALFVDQLPGFESLPQRFNGGLRISTSAATPVALIGIRGHYNERRDFLMSVVHLNADPAVAGELYFPHVVQGGGFTTQVVLYSTSNTASGVVRFFSQTGNPASTKLE
jgi:hypothetical protein